MNDFIHRVLEIFSNTHADAYRDLIWHVKDGEIRFYADVSDVFIWASADLEPITPETMHVLEKAYADLKALGAEEYTADLYGARQRGQRPQGAAYPTSAHHKSWRQIAELFDACGPERPTSFANPKKTPTHQETT